MAVTAGDGVGLLDDLLVLGEDELDVAGVGHIGVDLGETSLLGVAGELEGEKRAVHTRP